MIKDDIKILCELLNLGYEFKYKEFDLDSIEITLDNCIYIFRNYEDCLRHLRLYCEEKRRNPN